MTDETFIPSMLLEDPVFTIEHSKLGLIKFKELSVKEVLEFMRLEDLGERGFRMTLRRLSKADPSMNEQDFVDSKVNYLMLEEVAAVIQEFQMKHFRRSALGSAPMTMPKP